MLTLFAILNFLFGSNRFKGKTCFVYLQTFCKTSFTQDREDVNNCCQHWRPSTLTINLNVEAVRKIFTENLQITINEVLKDIAIFVDLYRALDVLGMKRIATRLPNLL